MQQTATFDHANADVLDMTFFSAFENFIRSDTDREEPKDDPMTFQGLDETDQMIDQMVEELKQSMELLEEAPNDLQSAFDDSPTTDISFTGFTSSYVEPILSPQESRPLDNDGDCVTWFSVEHQIMTSTYTSSRLRFNRKNKRKKPSKKVASTKRSRVREIPVVIPPTEESTARPVNGSPIRKYVRKTTTMPSVTEQGMKNLDESRGYPRYVGCHHATITTFNPKGKTPHFHSWYSGFTPSLITHHKLYHDYEIKVKIEPCVMQRDELMGERIVCLQDEKCVANYEEYRRVKGPTPCATFFLYYSGKPTFDKNGNLKKVISYAGTRALVHHLREAHGVTQLMLMEEKKLV